MLSVVRKMCVILIVFLVSIELFSYVYLQFALRPPSELPPFQFSNWKTIKPESALARRLLHWKELNPEIEKDIIPDTELRNDTPAYKMIGEKSGMKLFKSQYEHNPNIDDDFVQTGVNTGRVKYRVHYSTDEFGRRKTGHESIPKAKLNIIFLGCSYTFGEGVSQADSFPSKMATLIPSARSFNFGVSGSSPSKTLKMITDKGESYFKGIDRSLPTVVVYTFIDDQFLRLLGSSKFLGRYRRNYFDEPYYSLDESKLKYNGTFSDSVWEKHSLYFLFGMSNLSKATGLDFPAIEENEYRLLAKMMGEIKNKAGKILNLKGFYFSVFPGQNLHAKNLKQHLADEKLDLLDYSMISEGQLLRGHKDLGTDLHPSPLLYDLYAFLLAGDIGITE